MLRLNDFVIEFALFSLRKNVLGELLKIVKHFLVHDEPLIVFSNQ